MEAIFTENSSDLDDLMEEYKNELIHLNANLKALNRDLDFSAVVNPLLAVTGPAVTHVPKLAKQIARMKKYISQEQATAVPARSAPAQTSGSSSAAAILPRARRRNSAEVVNR